MDGTHLTPEAHAAPRRWPRALLVLALVTGGIVGVMIYRAVDVLVGANFHVVIPGQVYRGAQPSPKSLARLIDRHGIRTVLNLRGCCHPADWYIEQARVCQDRNVQLEDIGLAATHLPSVHEVRILLDVLERAERPIFIHCRHGADRTGLAIALLMLLDENMPYAQGRQHLGLWTGHLPVGRTTHVDDFFSLYEAWLEKTGNPHTPDALRTWIRENYQGGRLACRFDAVELLAPAKTSEPTTLDVTLTNLSEHAWQFRPTTHAGFHLLVRVKDENENTVYHGRGGMLDRRVASGDTVTLRVVIPPLMNAGKYRVNLQLMEEGHAWGSQAGVEPWEQEWVIRE